MASNYFIPHFNAVVGAKIYMEIFAVTNEKI